MNKEVYSGEDTRKELDINIKELIKDNNVYFVDFSDGLFTYKIYQPLPEEVGNEAEGLKRVYYTFNVPLEETKGAVMKRVDKAIFYMRWIRKSIKDKTFIKHG